ncbi:hypothetical protein Tco_1211371 [Tanacetum coccineum]
MANVLSSMGAANILASGGLKEVFTTASPPVPPVSLFVPTVAATASEKDSTAAVITTTTVVTPYTRRTRASRGVVMTSSSPIPINIPSISKEDKGKGIMTEPAKPTKQKVQEQMSEQLSEKDFARIKKYQAQQQRLASKSERRNFYTSVLRSHAGWKTKDFRGMTFDSFSKKSYIPVWEA